MSDLSQYQPEHLGNAAMVAAQALLDAGFIGGFSVKVELEIPAAMVIEGNTLPAYESECETEGVRG